MHKGKAPEARRKEEEKLGGERIKEERNFRTRGRAKENFHFLREFSVRGLRFSACQIGGKKIRIFLLLDDSAFSKASGVGLFCWTRCRSGSFHNSQRCWEYSTGQGAEL